MSDLKHSEVVRKAGQSTLRKHGKEHFSQMGKKGAAGKMKKYGPEYFKELSRKGIEARKRKKEEKAGALNRVLDTLSGEF